MIQLSFCEALAPHSRYPEVSTHWEVLLLVLWCPAAHQLVPLGLFNSSRFIWMWFSTLEIKVYWLNGLVSLIDELIERRGLCVLMVQNCQCIDSGRGAPLCLYGYTELDNWLLHASKSHTHAEHCCVKKVCSSDLFWRFYEMFSSCSDQTCSWWGLFTSILSKCDVSFRWRHTRWRAVSCILLSHTNSLTHQVPLCAYLSFPHCLYRRQLQQWASPSHTWRSTKTRARMRWRLTGRRRRRAAWRTATCHNFPM